MGPFRRIVFMKNWNNIVFPIFWIQSLRIVFMKNWNLGLYYGFSNHRAHCFYEELKPVCHESESHRANPGAHCFYEELKPISRRGIHSDKQMRIVFMKNWNIEIVRITTIAFCALFLWRIETAQPARSERPLLQKRIVFMKNWNPVTWTGVSWTPRALFLWRIETQLGWSFHLDL